MPEVIVVGILPCASDHLAEVRYLSDPGERGRVGGILKLGLDDVHPADIDAQGDEVQSSYHRIFIAPGSKLAATVGSGGFVRVNSRHRRGVTEAQRSPSLMASAYSLEDGVIEALEVPHHRWVVGVQFQPERRGELPPHFDRLFEALVDKAAGVTHTTT